MDERNPVIRVEKKGAIAHAILCNPKKLNAMGAGFQEDLSAAFEQIDLDDDIRVVVLSGEGRSFCAGLDLAAFATSEPVMMMIPPPTYTKPIVLQVIRRFQAAINSVEKCRKPVIAAIQGHCIGGGLDLAAACDIRLASADAVFSLRETRVAIMADLGSLQRLPHIIGEGHTRQLAYTAEDIDAERALKINLVNEVLENPDALLQRAMEMAETIAKNAPLSVQASKEVLNWGRGRNIDETLEYVAARNAALLPSEDLVEALSSFMERRDPNFKGR